MKNLILLPTGYSIYKILTEPVNGLTFLAAIISVLFIYKTVLRLVNKLRKLRLYEDSVPDEVLSFYINKR
jgi:hypothetical protein